MTVLSPADDAMLNARRLEVQALVTGKAEAAEITLDGILVGRIPIDRHAREFLIEVGLDLTTLAAGEHTLAVTAFEDCSHPRRSRNASVRFTLDPDLPLGDLGPIERALRPHPFAAMIFDGDRDDGDRDGETTQLHGRIVLGQESDGIDPEQDTVVVALGSVPALILPGAFRCEVNGHGRRTCRFRNAAHSVVRRVELKERDDDTWDVKLKAASPGVEPSLLFVRIGNDAGGADLETGALLAGRPPELDTARQAASPIGPEGGTIGTTDAAGVVISLTVPSGALTRDTFIMLTPLLESPLPGVVAPLHPGVKLEPAGLRFDRPVTLTLDASATGQVIAPGQGVLLVTSPLTVQPLLGTVDPATGTLTAQLRHFSTTQGGTATGASVDLNAVLRALPDPAAMTLEDVAQLVALVGLAIQLEKDGDPLCANGFCAAFIQTLQPLGLAALNIIVPANCQASPATLAAIDEIFRQEGLRPAFGASDDLTFSCRKGLMQRVIEAAEATAVADPSNANLTALFLLSDEATVRGYGDLADRAQSKVLEIVQQLRDSAVQQCATDQNGALVTLRRLLNLGAGILLLVDDLELVRAFSDCAIRITPSPATVQMAGEVQFSVSVAPPLGPTVNWSVAPASGGTIDQTGRFKAGNLTGTFTIRATSASDPAVFGEAGVTVTQAPIQVSVSPAAAIIAPGGTAQFTATVTGTPNTAVTWTRSGGGTISQTGLFTAGTTAGTFTVRATSVADTNVFAEATVTVVGAGLEGTYLGIGREFDGQDRPPIIPHVVAAEVIVANVGGAFQLKYRRQGGPLAPLFVFAITASGNSFSGTNVPSTQKSTVTGTLTGTTLTGRIVFEDSVDPAQFSWIEFEVTR